jgi:hypothetical protein
VVGISVVTQSRLRFGGGGGRICLATRIDAETGRTTARVGWFDAVMRWSHWEPFFAVLKRIADPVEIGGRILLGAERGRVASSGNAERSRVLISETRPVWPNSRSYAAPWIRLR